MLLKLLLKYNDCVSNLFLFQDLNRHLSSMALILWTTKDKSLILISFLGVNRLFYVAGSSYPTTKFPTQIDYTTSTQFNIRDWTEIQGRVNQYNHFYFPTSPESQKPPKFPQCNMCFSQDKTHSIPSSKSLETSHMSCHTTTPEILEMFILSFVLVPIKTHATTLDLFLTFIAQRKFFHQDSSNPVILIKFYFYLLQHPKIKIQPHFLILQKVQQLSFSFITLNLLSLPQPASNIFLVTSSPRFPKISLLISL